MSRIEPGTGAASQQRASAARRITLYGRPGCHLCDEARDVLERVGEPFAFVNIEEDDELFKRYLERIPVVAVDGEEAFELFVDEDALQARLH